MTHAPPTMASGFSSEIGLDVVSLWKGGQRAPLAVFRNFQGGSGVLRTEPLMRVRLATVFLASLLVLAQAAPHYASVMACAQPRGPEGASAALRRSCCEPEVPQASDHGVSGKSNLGHRDCGCGCEITSEPAHPDEPPATLASGWHAVAVVPSAPVTTFMVPVLDVQVAHVRACGPARAPPDTISGSRAPPVA
jgi:hypothetical protein